MTQYFNKTETILCTLTYMHDDRKKTPTFAKINLGLELRARRGGNLTLKYVMPSTDGLPKRGATTIFYLYEHVVKLCSLCNLNLMLTAQLKKYWNRYKFFFAGLGYKVYTRANTLFIWVGLTHYTGIDFPHSIFVFAKKRRVYILSSTMSEFRTLLDSIARIKKRDIYKGKGLLEVKSYKNFIKMKTGKKKQY
jgi:hypothetical protein